MKFISENKDLLIKYLYIIITNILIYIFTYYYLKDYLYKDLVMFLIVIIIDKLLYHYKGIKKFKVYLDLIVNFIIGLILVLFTKDMIIYGTILFSLVFPNNIIFIRSRLSNKFIIKALQYLMMLIYTMITMFFNLIIFNLI